MRKQEATLNIIIVLELIGLVTLQVEALIAVEALLLVLAQIEVILLMEDLQVQLVHMADLQDQVEVLHHSEDPHPVLEVAVLLVDLLRHQVAGLLEAAQEVVVPEVVAHLEAVEVVDNILKAPIM